MLNEKKILLLGGGHAEIPLIQAAHELGYFVITTGNARDGLGHPYADKTVFEDFSNKEKMLELAQKEKVDFVCSGCNDFALLSTAYVCEKLGLPGHDSYEISLQIHHKDKYRKLAEQLNIPTPKAITVFNKNDFDRSLENLSFPVIIKPVDLTGGKGIHRANSAKEAEKAYAEAIERTRENHVVIEEFVEGSNHGFSAFLVNKKVAFYFDDNEQYYMNKYMVSGANHPSSSDSKTLELLVGYSEKIARELELQDGILHIQYIEKNDGTPVIIEICRRPPGDLYIKFVKYATGIDYPKYLVLAETGDKNCQNISFEKKQKTFWLRHCVMADSEGVLERVSIEEQIEKNIVEKFLWYKEGEIIADKMYYKAGIVFFRFDSFDEMLEKTKKMNEYVKILVKKS